MKKSDTPFLDRVFLHSKNADERLFDMILRIITFIVLIIILWLYVDLSHARAAGLHFSDHVFGENPYNFSMYLNSTDALTASENFTDVPYSATYSTFSGYGDYDPLILDSMDFENNYFFIAKNITSGSTQILIQFIPKDYVLDGDFCFIGQTSVYVKSAFDSPYYVVNSNQLETSSAYSLYNRTVPTGYITLNQFLGAVSSNWAITFTNIPMLKGSAVDQTAADAWLSSKENQLYTCFNVNYVSYDGVSNLPSSIPNVESDSNHLYLKDYSIGLTSADFLLDSNLIISAKWDNWVEKYITHYKMVIVYSLDYNGEPWSRMDVNPPIEQPFHWMVTDTVPLGKFASYYSIGIRDIFSRMGINDQSAVAICNALQQSGAIIATENGSTTVQDVLNGLTAEYKVSTNGIGASGGVNLGVLYAFLHEQLDTLHAGETSVFIDDFRLNVTFYLVSDRLTQQENSDYGGSGSADFNFISGTTDYTYDILNNDNEWSEPNTPNINNETANTNSSSGDISNSNIAYGGNANSTVGDITISTGNGYKDTELHQLTDQDIVHNHQKIITVIEDLKYCFHQFAEENNHNSFMQMIIDDYGQIPGVEYIATSIIILCGVCILIFIIKIAF